MTRGSRDRFHLGAAAFLWLAMLALPADAAAGGRGSVRAANRGGGGGSYSGARGTATTSRSATASTSSRTTTAQSSSGNSATATRDVSRSGDSVTVNHDVATSSGAGKSSSKTYEMDGGHVDSVSRDVQATSRTGQTAEWQGNAERSGYGWEFEGEGKNRYGQKVEAEGYGARGPYGSAVVADVEGGRHGDRTVVAGRAYGGPVYTASLPYGARPYMYHGHSYYVHGGVYYNPYHFHGAVYYGHMPPPWGVFFVAVPVGAIAVTVAGASLMYSDGTYYETVYVEGSTQYQVVAPPAGAKIPGTSLPEDRVAITISGTTYYLYANTFYMRLVAEGKENFVVVAKPAGLVSVKELPGDCEPLQKGSVLYFRSKDRHYVSYLDPGGEQLYVVADPPVGAVPAVPGQAGGAAPATAPAAPAPSTPAAAKAPTAKPKMVTLTVAAGTPLTVRVSTGFDPKSTKAGERFQGNLAADLVVDGRVLATAGTKVYGRVVEATAGTGSGGKPVLVLELTDIELNARVIPLVTEKSGFSGEGAKGGGKKVAGGTALGAGIGGTIDGGEGAAVGTAATSASPGSQVAVAAGTALEFRLAKPVSIDVVI